MSSSIVISGISSAKEAAEVVLGQIPKERITKIVVILFNEPNVTTFTNQVDLWKFWELNQSLCVRWRADYGCFSMQPGAGGRMFSTVQVYVEDDPDAWTLVADLESNGSEGFPFWGRFTAGPFDTMEAAEEYAVKLLVREGIAIETIDGPEWRLNAELDPDGEWFGNHSDLIEAWQECLEGLEWFHIFPALKIPPTDSPAEVLPH